VNNQLTDRAYWAHHFGDLTPFAFGPTQFSKYLDKILPVDSSLDCIEIGAFPGTHVGYLAKRFGYSPTALDFHDKIEFVRANFAFNGIHNCEIVNADFLNWQPHKTYDVVCSHGFVEHFENYRDVLAKHASLVSPGGWLIISVPHLEFLQLWIRQELYTKERLETILGSHNREIMNLPRLKEVVFDQLGLAPVFAEYISEMSIWFPPEPGVIQMDKKPIYDFLKTIEVKFRELGVSDRLISPEILVVGRKSRVTAY